MISSLLWPAGGAPGALGIRSPWVDARIRPIEGVAEALAGQEHRRFIKTHSPANTIPLDPSVRYVTVYRSAPDALVSWGNHRAKLNPTHVELSNELCAADGIAPIPLQFEGDYDVLFDEWSMYCSPAIHLASWWTYRKEPNVLLLHYADMLADLPHNMRRIAEFLDIDVPEACWPAVVDRCRLDAMREAADRSGRMDQGFDGGARAFFYKGGNGRGTELLSSAQLSRCEQHCSELLADDALVWLPSGSMVSGIDPATTAA